MGRLSIGLLVWTFSHFFALIGSHILMTRLKKSQSPQMALVKLILLLNIPLLMGVGAIFIFERFSIAEGILMLLYSFMIYNALGYAYFHFFNMSETARRIRILIHIASQGQVTLSELEKKYTPAHMVSNRLARLVQMGQIKKNADDIYLLKSARLLLIAKCIKALRFMTHRQADMDLAN